MSYRVLGATVLAVLLSAGAQAGAAQSPPRTEGNLRVWQAEMAKVAHPSAKGCFTADFPLLRWGETGCSEAPSVPMVPKPGPRPMVVGNGNDISAQAPAGLISQAIGTFENVINVTSVQSPIGNTGPPVADAYTLLKPDIRQRAEGICRQAKVPTAWLEFCVLDVAVIGEQAAQVFVGLEPPVLNGNP